MLLLLSALIVAAAIVWAARQRPSAGTAPASGADLQEARVLALLQLFAPAIAAAPGDPRVLTAWHPLALAARRLFPAEFSLLDDACAGAFPFTAAHVEAAHAQWTADWLAWERAHDERYKLKTIEIEHQPADAAVVRTRLDANEREKLEQYQRKYEEYVRVARALQAMVGK